MFLDEQEILTESYVYIFFSCTVSAFGFLPSNFHLSIHALFTNN